MLCPCLTRPDQQAGIVRRLLKVDPAIEERATSQGDTGTAVRHHSCEHQTGIVFPAGTYRYPFYCREKLFQL